MITNRLVSAVTIAAAFLAIAFGLKAAQHAGWLDFDASKRIIQVFVGLGLTAYANLMPKQIGPLSRSPLAQARIQTSLRISGWAFAVAGLIYAGLWAFTPLAFADTASMVVVIGAMAVTLGYVAWCLANRSSAKAG